MIHREARTFKKKELARTWGKNKTQELEEFAVNKHKTGLIGEMCALRWDDLNEDHKTIIVRDRKDPRKKEGNQMVVALLAGSFDIVKR